MWLPLIWLMTISLVVYYNGPAQRFRHAAHSQYFAHPIKSFKTFALRNDKHLLLKCILNELSAVSSRLVPLWHDIYNDVGHDLVAEFSKISSAMLIACNHKRSTYPAFSVLCQAFAAIAVIVSVRSTCSQLLFVYVWFASSPLTRFGMALSTNPAHSFFLTMRHTL